MTNGLIAEGVIVVAENGRVGLRLDQARLVNNDRQAGSLKIRQRDDEPTIRPGSKRTSGWSARLQSNSTFETRSLPILYPTDRFQFRCQTPSAERAAWF